MDTQEKALLRSLFVDQPVGSLATLHQSNPAVSMVPFVLLEPDLLAIHVSELAAHTRDMRLHPHVSLMVMQTLAQARSSMPDQAAEVTPLALARASASCLVEHPERGGSAWQQAQQAYLDKYPESEPLCGCGDFSLVLLRIQDIRWVAGFGRARSVRQVPVAAS